MQRIVASVRDLAQGPIRLDERGLCLAEIPSRQFEQLLGRIQLAP